MVGACGRAFEPWTNSKASDRGSIMAKQPCGGDIDLVVTR
jgi:hypothetical protein